MIKSTFKLGGEVVEVIIKGNELLFYDVSSQLMTPVTGLRFSKAGVLKEHPDLKDDVEWKRKAIERLKEHIKKIKTEKETLDYVKKELEKYGYEALYFQQAGHRQKKWGNK